MSNISIGCVKIGKVGMCIKRYEMCWSGNIVNGCMYWLGELIGCVDWGCWRSVLIGRVCDYSPASPPNATFFTFRPPNRVLSTNVGTWPKRDQVVFVISRSRGGVSVISREDECVSVTRRWWGVRETSRSRESVSVRSRSRGGVSVRSRSRGGVSARGQEGASVIVKREC